jgi:hypothetical protein
MSPVSVRNTARWFVATSTRRAVTTIILAVFFANSLYLLGISNYDAIGWTSNLVAITCHALCGNPSIDPNTGWLSTDLGHRAALDLLHGHFPWWNQYEGLGSPLAGEMQSAALFPLVVLLAFSNGLLYMHVALELIAGLATYFWIRKLGVSNFAATCAGVLFAINATFAWVGNATINPIAFLPLALLGVELLPTSATSKRHSWWILALAVALSLYAGFPEVALFDTILVTLYAVVRFFTISKLFRWRCVRTFAYGIVSGLALSAPVLIAFKDYSQQALVGMHGTGRSATIGLPMHALPMFLSPYSFGPFFQVPVATPMWSFIGGFFGVTMFVLALYGCFGKRLRSLRFTLAGYVVFAFPAIMGITPVRKVWNLIPFVSQSLLDRYIMPSIEMALIVLAVLAFDDMRESFNRRRALWATVSTFVFVVLGTVEASLTRNYSPLNKASINEEIIGRSIPFVILTVLLVLVWKRPRRITGYLACVLVFEMGLYFMIPTYWAPAAIKTDNAPIAFLQKNLGIDRIFTLGPIAPNWGSYFGISELNEVDLPFPTKFADEIETKLAPGERQSVNQFFVESGVSNVTFFEDVFAKNISQYELLSVKYLVTSSTLIFTPALENLHLQRVFHDSGVSIYALPAPTPFFSTWNHGCTVSPVNYSKVTVNCPTASVLTRDELALNGWSAEVNGRSVSIEDTPLLQTVRVPGGKSVVTFSYLPEHEKLAVLIALVALVLTLALAVLRRIPSVMTKLSDTKVES